MVMDNKIIYLQTIKQIQNTKESMRPTFIKTLICFFFLQSIQSSTDIFSRIQTLTSQADGNMEKLQISGDGKFIVSSRSGKADIFSSLQETTFEHFQTLTSSLITAIAITSDHRRILTGLYYSSVLVFQLDSTANSFSIIQTITTPQESTSVAITDNYQRVAIAEDSGNITMYELNSSNSYNAYGDLITDSSLQINSLQLMSRRGSLSLGASSLDMLQDNKYSLSTGRSISARLAQGFLDMSPRYSVILNSERNQLYIYDSSVDLFKDTIVVSVSDLYDVQISRNQDFIIVCGSDIEIYQQDRGQYYLIQTLSEDIDFNTCSISNNGQILVAGVDNQVYVYGLGKIQIQGIQLPWWQLSFFLAAGFLLIMTIIIVVVLVKCPGSHPEQNTRFSSDEERSQHLQVPSQSKFQNQ